MATKRKLRHRKLRKAGKSSRKHQRTFRRKNRVKRNSKISRRRVMMGGVQTFNIDGTWTITNSKGITKINTPNLNIALGQTVDAKEKLIIQQEIDIKNEPTSQNTKPMASRFKEAIAKTVGTPIVLGRSPTETVDST